MREHQGTKRAESQAEAASQRGGKSMPAVAAFQMKNAGAFGKEALPESEMGERMGKGPVQMKGHMAASAAVPVVQRVMGSGVVQMANEWATDEIRAQIAEYGADKSGHHIISKERLSDLLKWAKADEGRHHKRKAGEFQRKYPNDGMLHNLGFNIIVGMSGYSNDPNTSKNKWDPGTVKAELSEQDTDFAGMDEDEAAAYGLEKRVDNRRSNELAALQIMIEERVARDEKYADENVAPADRVPWSEDEWGTVINTLDELKGDDDEGAQRVNPYRAGEWKEDLSLQSVGLGKADMKKQRRKETKLVDADKSMQVIVDGKYIKVVDGVLFIDNAAIELHGGRAAIGAGGILQVNGLNVKIDGRGKFTINDEPLKKIVRSSYRKRAGLVLNNVEGDGESIFAKAARTKRTLREDVAINIIGHYSMALAKHNMSVTVKYGLSHILARHSLQWWNGDTTNRNVFFRLAMNDHDIMDWCRTITDAYIVDVILPAFEEMKRADPKDVSFEHVFEGSKDNAYMNMRANAAKNAKKEWHLNVDFKTLAPTESSGIQITQKDLFDFKKYKYALPLKLSAEGKPLAAPEPKAAVPRRSVAEIIAGLAARKAGRGERKVAAAPLGVAAPVRGDGGAVAAALGQPAAAAVARPAVGKPATPAAPDAD